MRKNPVIPFVLFVLSFITGLLFLNCTFIHQGQFGLFLLTPDYLKQAFLEPFPFSYILSSFLVQFYDIPAAGALLTAAMTLAVYFLVNGILRRFGVDFRFPGVLISCLFFVFSALAPTPQYAVAALLALLALRLLCLFLKPKASATLPPLNILSICIIAGACVFVALNPKARQTELHSKMEVFSRQHQWDRILKAAGPEVARKDRYVIPYAMLALNAKGQLISGMDAYPVRGPEDLDMDGVVSREAYWFSSILYECLGCSNEAIHCVFQASCFLPQGMSHISLYQLIRFNIENENYTLVRKYARILMRSPRHRGVARKILDTYGNLPDRARTEDKAAAGVITKSPKYNLAEIFKAGIASSLVAERLAAYMKLSGGTE